MSRTIRVQSADTSLLFFYCSAISPGMPCPRWTPRLLHLHGLRLICMSPPAGRYHIEVNLFGRSYQPGAPFYKKVLSTGVWLRSNSLPSGCPGCCESLVSHHAQVMACLTERTAPLDLMCVKTIDGAPAEIHFPPGCGVTFSSQQTPRVTRAVLPAASLPLPMSQLLRSGSAQAEGQVGAHISTAHTAL